MLNILLTLIVIILFYSVMLLMARIVERFRELRGEELDYTDRSRTHSRLFVIYGVIFFLICGVSLKVLDYCSLPEAASNWGVKIDKLFSTTAYITGIVFVICHLLLFYFVWSFYQKKDRKATFFAHSGTLELIWTTLPALAMTVLVVMGLRTWFDVFPNKKTLKANELQIEATGKQFNWIIRYPGPDGVFGRRVISNDFVSTDNELGIDWTDPASRDDFFASELYMVKDRPVHFNLGALDVLHSFYLPHFRLKMDCVPGVPTSLGFTPTKTNDETRELLKKNLYWSSIDPETSQPRYAKFNYELACAELCGKSHYGMMVPAHVVSQAKFDEWMKSQKSIYESNKDKIEAWLKAHGNKTEIVVEPKKVDFAEMTAHGIDENAVYATDAIQFEVNSAELNPKAKSHLDQLASLLVKFNDKTVNLGAHTDSDGDDNKNMDLSSKRADACKAYLISKGIAAERVSAKGYGESKPIADNAAPEGKQKNRRTEFDFN